ncbi:MAG: DUF4382 domain-containing protein [Pseudomonadota bacterium]|nr:MAG: DUF4382 domain-containing protein [Pseudomonadota bacterium]
MKTVLWQRGRFLACLVVFALITACGGGSGSESAGTGQLTVAVTDAPVDGAQAVVVTFTGVKVHGNGETLSFDFDPDREVDLLQLQGGLSVNLLDGVVLPAGDYQWMRFEVAFGIDKTYIINSAGEQHALEIPSGAQTGLKMNRNFTVSDGGHVAFMVDFDLRESVVYSPGKDKQNDNGRTLHSPYKLKPKLRVMEQAVMGRISGSVDLAAISCLAENTATYVYAGQGVTPDDMWDGNPNNPVTSAKVMYDAVSMGYRYTALVPPGEYTVALTCQANEDNADTDENIDFIDPQNAIVAVGSTTVINFPLAPPPPSRVPI